MRGFGSDNHSGVIPEVLASLAEHNVGHVPSYGTDPISQQASEVFKHHFGQSCETFLVFNGTGANVCALRALGLRGYSGVLCSEESHIHKDECGAPERIGGVKLLPLPSPGAKLQVKDLGQAYERRGDQHHIQIEILSLTQPTELGTCYSLSELKELTAWAKSKKMGLHMDGARLPLAARRLGLTFAEFTTNLGIDIVTFGGTKNGLMGGEAILVLNPDLNEPMRYLRKQCLQLPSKSRFIASQFLAYFKDDLWIQHADHSLKMAELLFEKTRGIPDVEISHPPEANSVFAKIPKEWVGPLRKKFFFYVWDEKEFLCRWMTSFDTTEEDITAFAQALAALSTD